MMKSLRAIITKGTLYTAAFVLAVSSLTAAAPFVVSERVDAIGSEVGALAVSDNTVTEVSKTQDSVTLRFGVNSIPGGMACFDVESDAATVIPGHQQSICLGLEQNNIEITFNNVVAWISVSEFTLDGSTEAQRFDVAPAPVLDTVSPVVTVTPGTSSPLSGTVAFTVTIADDNLDTDQLKNVQLIFSKQSDWSQKYIQNVDLSSGGATITVDTSLLADGTDYRLRVPTFTDLAGNNAVGGGSLSGGPYDMYFNGYTLDNTAPTITWQLQPKTIYGIGEGFAVRPITNEVGTVKSIYIDSVTPENLVRTLTSDHKNFDTSNSSNQSLWNNLTDGEHKFIAVFTDYAGNTTVSESRAFITDRTKPTITLRENQTIKPSGSYFNLNETIRVQPQDVNRGKVFINGKEYTQYEGSGSFGINWIIAQNPTVDTFVITTQDKAGNMSDEYVVLVDRDAPTISQFIFENAKDGVYNPAKVIAKATDGSGSGVTNVYINVYRKDSAGNWKQQGGTFEQANPAGRDFAEMSRDYALIKNDGVYRLEAWSKDAMGNIGDKKWSDEFVVDATAPVLAKPILFSDGKLAENSIVKGTKTFRIEQVENNADEIYVEVMTKNASGDWKKDHGKGYKGVNVAEFTVNTNELSEGLHQIKISTKDKTNLKDGYSFTFTVDRSGPSITASVVPDVTPGGVYLNLSVADNYSAVSSAKYTIYNDADGSIYDGNKNVPFTGVFGLSTVNLSQFIDTASMPNGTYRVQLHSTDALGNQGKRTTSFTVNNIPASIQGLLVIDNGDGTSTVSGRADTRSVTVTVTLDGVDYENIPIGPNGFWSTIVTNPTVPGTYDVDAVAFNSAGHSQPTTKKLAILEAEEVATDTENRNTTTGGAAARSDQQRTNTPLTPPADQQTSETGASSEVLGAQTENEGTPEVKGAATESVAQAANTDAKENSIGNLAWYWWVLIAAAVVGLIWWIIAAARRRNSEA